MRSDLRLSDLENHNRCPVKLVNVRIPAAVMDEIERVVRETGATKTDVIVALLNEGLDCVPKPGQTELPEPRECGVSPVLSSPAAI